jgi:hypothetical protein
MADLKAISLQKFTASVHAAVKSAQERHTKFKFAVPNSISISYLIRGFPAPEALLNNATLAEVQSFANDVAAHLENAHPELLKAPGRGNAQGAVISVGGHVVIGIPPVAQIFELEE